MKAFVLNLERSPERRAHIRSEVEGAGLEYEFVPATDGRLLSNAALEQIVDPEVAARAPRWLMPGVIGACMSHLEAYRRIVAEDLGHALVLEDDAVVPAAVGSLLAALVPELARAEVALLYYTARHPAQLSSQNAVALPDGAQLLYPIDLAPVNSAAAYVITRSACERMIDFIVPITTGADAWRDFVEAGVLDRVRCVSPRQARVLTSLKSTIDYVGHATSTSQRLTTAIASRKVFPLYQLLAGRRALLARRASRITIVSAPSPYALRQP